MPDHFLVVIPTDPKDALPESADGIRTALAELAGSEESRVKDYGKLQFIDAGENLEAVTCPKCATEIPQETWEDWMSRDWHGEDGFHLHRHKAPCCGANVTLNDLVYHGPQGFARWFVSARDSNKAPLSDQDMSRLEQIAGLKLKAIYQKY